MPSLFAAESLVHCARGNGRRGRRITKKTLMRRENASNERLCTARINERLTFKWPTEPTINDHLYGVRSVNYRHQRNKITSALKLLSSKSRTAPGILTNNMREQRFDKHIKLLLLMSYIRSRGQLFCSNILSCHLVLTSQRINFINFRKARTACK